MFRSCEPVPFLPFRVECPAQADHHANAAGGFSSRRYNRFACATTLKLASLPTGSRHLHLGFQLRDRSPQLPSMTTVPTKRLHWEDFHLLDEQCYGLHRTGHEDFPHPALLKILTRKLKPDYSVVVVQAKLTIDIIRGKLVPPVPTSATPSPDDMPDSKIHKVSQLAERR